MVAMSRKTQSKNTSTATTDPLEKLVAELVPIEQAASELGFKSVRRVQQFCKQGRLGRLIMNRVFITRHELDEFKKLERPTGIKKEFHVKRR